MACFTVRGFRSFDFLRVAAVMMSGCLGSACFRMVMIVAEQVLDAAMRSREQPKHDTACRHNAEAEVDLWLPRNHTFNSFHYPMSGGGGRTETAPPRKPHYFFSVSFSFMPWVSPLLGLVV